MERPLSLPNPDWNFNESFNKDVVIFVFEIVNLAPSARRALKLAFLVPPEHNVCAS